ncbi:RGPR-related [Dorcoceras hygrometricum]|uniref:RGPR-related n=1 Tax=Dorcoceras hygrometricum TaxID=472368 RepID=A0A2Z6ZS14_9LAMI|nr:RGPR-related [Dorcoceras hygrometricum]
MLPRQRRTPACAPPPALRTRHARRAHPPCAYHDWDRGILCASRTQVAVGVALPSCTPRVHVAADVARPSRTPHAQVAAGVARPSRMPCAHGPAGDRGSHSVQHACGRRRTARPAVPGRSCDGGF